MTQGRVLDSLKNNPLRKELIHHRFFSEIKSGQLTRNDVAIFLGQWWHPLHYFPNFLSRSISVVPWLETKTAICAILSEELGEGDCDRGDGAGLDDREQGPPVEEAGERRESLAQEHVLATRIGHHRGELRVRQRAGDGHRAGHQPHHQQGAGPPLAHLAADVGGHDEDARTDHRAHHQGHGRQRADAADEFRGG